jgi:hypothetical protein
MNNNSNNALARMGCSLLVFAAGLYVALAIVMIVLEAVAGLIILGLLLAAITGGTFRAVQGFLNLRNQARYAHYLDALHGKEDRHDEIPQAQ